MSDSVSLVEFRMNTKDYFDAALERPQIIMRRNKQFILMSKEHYIDLINKIKMPKVAEMPANVHTIIHFQTLTPKKS